MSHSPHTSDTATEPTVDADALTDRRRFIGYLIAAPTLAAAAQIGGSALAGESAQAALPSTPQPADLLDLSDLLVTAAKPTSNLVAVKIHEDGTASFALPRAEMGQGITTSTAMLIAEELELPLNKIRVTLAKARPELLFNQFTGGSASTQATYTAIRVAAALARRRLLEAAATLLGDTVDELTTKAGSIISSTGEEIGFGTLAQRASVNKTTQVSVDLKPNSEFSVIGTPQNRIDALEAVTGRKKYAMDLDIKDAKPTMICRPPTINGSVQNVQNTSAVLAMPGVTDVAAIDTGVAVRAQTFGQCIDAVRALKVTWGAGSADDQSDATILKKLKKSQIPLAVPKLGLLGESIDTEFTFGWRSNSALEPQAVVADVRGNKAEVWACIQSPILAQEKIAAALGLRVDQVTVHVVEGGGGFGRMMFVDAPVEAAKISQKMSKPVKLMRHRTDDFRVGRAFPMCTTRIRAGISVDRVLSFEQRYTGVACDFSQGFGEILTETVAKVPAGNYAVYSTTIFETTARVPYKFGAVTQLLNEIFEYNTLHTGSVRNVYSPNVVTAVELTVDQIAKKMKKDPYKFRRESLKDKRLRNVLDAVAKRGDWGKKLPRGVAQGIALHGEYKSAAAALVEIDTRRKTVERPIREGVTGPRVTKVVFAVDVGLAINPRGLKAQMEGGIMEGIGQTLTESLHLTDGNFDEGSWDDYHFMRQWSVPPHIDVIVMEPTTGKPGGAGELAVAPAKAATAAAYTRAVGKLPARFPINHDDPLTFEPLPREPSIPQSPTDGLDHTY